MSDNHPTEHHHRHHLIERDESEWAHKPGTIVPRDTGVRDHEGDFVPINAVSPYPNQPWIHEAGAPANQDTVDSRAHGDQLGQNAAAHHGHTAEHVAVAGAGAGAGAAVAAHDVHKDHRAHDEHGEHKPDLAHRIEGTLKTVIGKVTGKEHLVEQGRQMKTGDHQDSAFQAADASLPGSEAGVDNHQMFTTRGGAL